MCTAHIGMASVKYQSAGTLPVGTSTEHAHSTVVLAQVQVYRAGRSTSPVPVLYQHLPSTVAAQYERGASAMPAPLGYHDCANIVL